VWPKDAVEKGAELSAWIKSAWCVWGARLMWGVLGDVLCTSLLSQAPEYNGLIAKEQIQFDSNDGLVKILLERGM
jgi:hypothetical protein